MVSASQIETPPGHSNAPTNLDPVAQRLAAAGDSQTPSILQWLEHQHQRKIMRRRGLICVIGAWLLVTVASIVSSVVAIQMSKSVHEIFEGGAVLAIPMSVTYLPILLVTLSVLLVAGGIACWLFERIPGFSSTSAAIDWSAASDAMSRLLSVGCPYPEAFRAAATIAPSRPSRTWLNQAAARVESGGPQVPPRMQGRGDTAVLETLIDTEAAEPQAQWQIAEQHFVELANRRLVLLLQSIPIISTIVSGLLIWVAISATLGWMWRAAASMISGLT